MLSSPSGARVRRRSRGGSIEKDPALTLSVSVTTRPAEAGERRRARLLVHRVSPASTEMVARDELLEHARVFGNCYGTPRQPIETALAAGRDIVGDLDWQGTRRLARKVHPDRSVFVLPPSLRRLKSGCAPALRTAPPTSPRGWRNRRRRCATGPNTTM